MSRGRLSHKISQRASNKAKRKARYANQDAAICPVYLRDGLSLDAWLSLDPDERIRIIRKVVREEIRAKLAENAAASAPAPTPGTPAYVAAHLTARRRVPASDRRPSRSDNTDTNAGRDEELERKIRKALGK